MGIHDLAEIAADDGTREYRKGGTRQRRPPFPFSLLCCCFLLSCLVAPRRPARESGWFPKETENRFPRAYRREKQHMIPVRTRNHRQPMKRVTDRMAVAISRNLKKPAVRSEGSLCEGIG